MSFPITFVTAPESALDLKTKVQGTFRIDTKSIRKRERRPGFDEHGTYG